MTTIQEPDPLNPEGLDLADRPALVYRWLPDSAVRGGRSDTFGAAPFGCQRPG